MSIELAGLLLTFIGTIAGVAQAWLAWNQARREKQSSAANNRGYSTINRSIRVQAPPNSQLTGRNEQSTASETFMPQSLWLVALLVGSPSILLGGFCAQASLKTTQVTLVGLFCLAVISSLAKRDESGTQNIGLSCSCALIGFSMFALAVLSSGNGSGGYKPGEAGSALFGGVMGGVFSVMSAGLIAPFLLQYLNRLQVFLILLAFNTLPFGAVWIIALDQKGGLDNPLFH
jgi:hypothetical protein